MFFVIIVPRVFVVLRVLFFSLFTDSHFGHNYRIISDKHEPQTYSGENMEAIFLQICLGLPEKKRVKFLRSCQKIKLY